LPYDLVLEDLLRRDAADSSRAAAPLAKASDAIVVDTDGRTVDEIVDELLELTERRARARREGGEH
jgi:cytidylate kinase